MLSRERRRWIPISIETYENEMIDMTGFVLWFTGLSASGKSAIADRVAEKLKERGLKIERLDGDIVRESLTKDLGFTEEDRNENIKRVTFVAKLLSRNDVGVIASFISPYRAIRNHVREEVTNFVEIFAHCPVDVCIERDPKGLYKQALNGEIENFTGISHPYEEPKNPDILLRTDKETPDESAEKVIERMEEMDLIS